MCMPNIWGGAVAPQRTSRITRECVCTNLFGLTHPLVYVLPCQATGPPAHREGGAQRSLPLHHAPLTGGAASRLAGSSPALRLNVFIIVLPVDSKAINGRSTDYLDGRSVFLDINPCVPSPCLIYDHVRRCPRCRLPRRRLRRRAPRAAQ